LSVRSLHIGSRLVLIELLVRTGFWKYATTQGGGGCVVLVRMDSTQLYCGLPCAIDTLAEARSRNSTLPNRKDV
jgi:hypothetical protein